MSSIHHDETVRVGLLADEPLRLEGLASIFKDSPGEGYAPLSPVTGTIEELLSDDSLEFLFVDLNSSSGRVRTLEVIHRRRPALRMIVLGPEGDDEQVLEAIMAGARAYLDLKASPRVVRQAVDVVISGSIWAPRRLLSQLIDRLLKAAQPSHATSSTHLTDRERQVLDQILQARSNREIAQELGIEESTVQAHVGRLMRKTGVDNRVDLLMSASDPALLAAAGIRDRRHADRRRRDRRYIQGYNPPPVTH